MNAIELDTTTNTAYIGGEFNKVGAISRTQLAEVSLTTGIATARNPVIDLPIYLGGYFDIIDGQSRSGIAKYDLATGVIDSTWNPPIATGATINTFDVGKTGDVYAGGIFASIATTLDGFGNSIADEVNELLLIQLMGILPRGNQILMEKFK